jgi:hypothetical protein
MTPVENTLITQDLTEQIASLHDAIAAKSPDMTHILLVAFTIKEDGTPTGLTETLASFGDDPEGLISLCYEVAKMARSQPSEEFAPPTPLKRGLIQ